MVPILERVMDAFVPAASLPGAQNVAAVCKSSGNGRTGSGIRAWMCIGARRELSVVSTVQHIVSAAGLLRTHVACQTTD